MLDSPCIKKGVKNPTYTFLICSISSCEIKQIYKNTNNLKHEHKTMRESSKFEFTPYLIIFFRKTGQNALNTYTITTKKIMKSAI
ncbi:hypothetical protein LINPERHAP1_LOCUS23602 [Linum perenne]